MRFPFWETHLFYVWIILFAAAGVDQITHGLAGSIVAILICTSLNVFPAVVIPLAFTCFFEGGAAAVVANAYGGVRGTIIATFLNGIIMVLLVGFGAYFFSNTIQDWMLVYGGNDFSLFGIIEGIIANLIA